MREARKENQKSCHCNVSVPRVVPHSATPLASTAASSRMAANVRVVTYNVLASVYAKSAWFPWTERALMKAKMRLQRSREYIESLNADLLCLQELDNYDDDGATSWKCWLESRGYDSRHVRRTNTKKDGSCVAWRRDAWSCEDHRAVSFNDIAREMYPTSNDESEENVSARERYLRDCVANLTILRRTADGAEALVASTHIFWDPNFADVKLAQAKRLVREVQTFRDERRRVSSREVHVIIGGDFNSEPTSDVYRELNSAFASASSGDEPPHTNVTPDFTACIDYVFLSSRDSGIEVVRVREQPSREELGAGLPNENHPSDHLPVVVDVAIPSA